MTLAHRLKLYFYNFVFNEFTVVASSIIGPKTRLQIVLGLPQVDLREAFRSSRASTLSRACKKSCLGSLLLGQKPSIFKLVCDLGGE